MKRKRQKAQRMCNKNNLEFEDFKRAVLNNKTAIRTKLRFKEDHH